MGSSGSKLPPQELDHLKKVTNYSSKELKSWYGHFINTYPSGRMNERQYLEYTMPSKEVLDIIGDSASDFIRLGFNAFDKGDRDYVTFRDIIMQKYLTEGGTKDEWIMSNFKIYDQRKTGKLTYDDVMLVQKAVDHMNGADLPVEQQTEAVLADKTANERCPRYFELLSKTKADTLDFKDFKLLVSKDRTAVVLDSSIY